MPVSDVLTFYNVAGLLTAFVLSFFLLAESVTSDNGVTLGIVAKLGLLFIEAISLWNGIKVSVYVWSPKFDGLLTFDERAFITGGGLVLVLGISLAIRREFVPLKRGNNKTED
jgi:hypothetical protein